MHSLKNALEEIVVAEVINQLRASSDGVRQKTNISEVAAYALNRLPPLYATTQRGWQQQKKRAQEELNTQIIQAVEQALLSVRPDPWRPATLLAIEVIETPADALARLRTIFSIPHLQWRDVPRVILDNLFLEEENQQTNPDEPTVPLPQQFMYGSDPKLRLNLRYSKEMLKPNNQQYQDFEAYITAATCTFTNVLENLVWQETERQLLRMTPVLPREVTIEDAVAYTLNRLPPMYATCEEGLERQQERAISDMGTAIASTVIQTVMTLSRLPRRIDAPIPLLEFEKEQEEAIMQVRLIAGRADITWRNLTKMVEDALEAIKASRFGWRRRWQMLGQLYQDMQLLPGDAELSLISEPLGDTLLVQVNSRRVLSAFTDDPKILAGKALHHFPNLDMVELWSPLIETSLTYTKAEMIMDGVIPLV
jgi:hypothetical protein